MSAVLAEQPLFHIIPAASIGSIWDYIAPGIERALETSDGEATVEDTKAGLVAGRTHLMLMADGQANLGVVFMLLDFPRFRIARVLLLFGTRMERLGEAMEAGESWARSQGCRFVEGWVATGSRERLFSRYGYSRAYTIVRKELKK